MIRYSFHSFFFLSLTLFSLSLFPDVLLSKNRCPQQRPRMTVKEYCDLYSAEARKQMKLYGIPASITLAQGIWESGYGSSYLANVAMNHFGIKAYRADWKGPVEYCDDDTEQEPFCKFSSVLEGYEYHSKFLKNSTRYARLFRLDPQDYEGWAHGLSECGYATDKTYPQRLIKLIEENNLDAYDVLSDKSLIITHKLYLTANKGGLKYIRCNEGETLGVIAKEFGISERKLRKWNDLPKDHRLKQNDIIYLQKKNSKASKGHDTHLVRPGDSLWGISQIYGVRLSKLVKRNKLTSGTLQAGQVLKLR